MWSRIFTSKGIQNALAVQQQPLPGRQERWVLRLRGINCIAMNFFHNMHQINKEKFLQKQSKRKQQLSYENPLLSASGSHYSEIINYHTKVYPTVKQSSTLCKVIDLIHY